MIRRLAYRAGLLPGESIFERGGWDICCVLDACRADALRRHYPDATRYRSVAESSKPWLKRTFGDRDCSDVAYVSGNPFAADLDSDRFGYFHLEAVDEIAGIETVAPDRLVDHALAVWANRELLGIDRLIVHFMQPHVPFRSRPEWFAQFRGTETWGSKAIERVAAGEIDRREWIAAYRDNLNWVLTDGVQPIVEAVDGRVAITADHGNAHGEAGVWGHPRRCAIDAVRMVPWLVRPGFGRGGDHELPTATTAIDTDDQLAALGYR